MKALVPILDDSRTKPYYLQLYDYIKSAILKGDIQEGEKLPSLRNLAASTNLSITTIEQCYNQLLVEGYIYSKAQSGYYVNSVFSHSNKTVYKKNDPYPSNLYTSKINIAPVPANFYYDSECFDFNRWKKCMNKVINEYSPVLFFESDPQGEKGLREEIARYLYLSRGVSCKPDQIFIGAGTQQITNHLATLLRKISIEHVSLETPGYMPVRNIFRDRGFAITSVPVSEDGLVLEKLPTNIRTAVYVSPSNHNPSGAVMPIGRRYELMNWALKNDSYIIEDDYDSELRYFGRPIPALKSLQNSNHVIYLGSFSSTLFAAVKISYMVLPEETSRIFLSIINDYPQTCSKLEQLTLALFMETGNYQIHIKKLRKLYSQKLETVTDVFTSYANDFIDLKNTSSGLNVILKINSAKNNRELKKYADNLGIHINPLHEEGLIALHYSSIPLSDIKTALKKLIVIWRS